MRRCGICGSKHLIMKSAKGSFFPYKDHPRVPLMEDYEVLTCQECNNQILSNTDVWRLNELLSKSLQILVEQSVREIMSVNVLRQSDVAKMVGKTPQYISNLKSGHKTASFSTLTLMRIFAKYPLVMEEFTEFKARRLKIESAPTMSDLKKNLKLSEGWVEQMHNLEESRLNRKSQSGWDVREKQYNESDELYSSHKPAIYSQVRVSRRSCG